MAGAMVEAQAVHKSFGRLEVLRGVTMEVAPKEVMCLIGPSGSGKSTFLRCINHLEKIDAGRLYVDGELVGYEQRGDKLYELRDSEVCRKRSEIGMVFQRFNLFPHMTALRERHRGAAPGQAREHRCRGRARPAAPRPRRARRQGRRASQPALRRPAAARRHRPCPGHGAEADALRRADVGARPRAGRRGARRDARPRRRAA